MKPDEAFVFDFNERFPHLEGAPIVEAVIHWIARAGNPLEAAAVETKLADRMADYPHRQSQHQLQFEARWGTAGSAAPARQQWHGFRVASADQLHVAQFTRDGLVFSRLAPYTSWQHFSAEALRVWQVFVDVADPQEVQRLGVRFINRVPLAKVADVAKYLAKPPKCLEPLKLPMSGFLYQSAHDVPSFPLQINVTETVQPPTPPQSDRHGLILDIDVGTTQAFPAGGEWLEQRLTQMHWLKNKAFFSLLSKKALLSFEKGES